MKFEPFGERVVVRLVEQKITTESGIMLTATTLENTNRGVVDSVGQAVKGYIKPGEKVIFTRGAGVYYTDGSESFRVISERDILGKIIED